MKYSDNPLVETYDNFLSEEECQHFINISKDDLKQALVSDNEKGYISDGRTGSNTWIKHDFDDITKSVGERISKIIGIPLENAEAYQIIYYDKTQEYKNHYDSWVHNESKKTLRCMKKGGARLMTALCYLNIVKKGGGTKMTKLDITISSERGKMLVFQNTISKEDHNRHPLSEHAGLPVEEGEKYAFNLWFRECPYTVLYKDFNPDYYKVKSTNIKNTINQEWTDYINNQLKIGISKDILETKLKNQNYSQRIINNLLYDNNDDDNDDNNDEDTCIIEINKNNILEIGDYFPFIKIGNRNIHSFVDNKYLVIISNNNILDISKIQEKYNIIIRNKDDNLFNMIPDMDDNIYILLISPNRRIMDIFDNIEILENLDLSNYNENYNIPFIKIENVLNEELLNEVIEYYNKKKVSNELIDHKHSTKDRSHVHPDLELEKKLDNKLSRSVLPELRKIYYFDAKNRENYKICSYDSESSGRFHSHRDTPCPNQHRKYAMSLILNDDYDGGELYFSEYDTKIKPKANTAIIFPGLSSHKVLEVTKGNRMAIITFFVTKNSKNYNMKEHFYDDRQVEYSEVFPY